MSVRSLAKRYGVSATTVQKSRKLTSTADARMGPKLDFGDLRRVEWAEVTKRA